MNPLDDLMLLLKKLHLSGVIQSLKLRIRQAVDNALASVEFICRLLIDEVERQEAKSLEQRIRRESLEHAQTLEDLNCPFNRTIPKAKIRALATCTWIDRAEHLLPLGQAGVSKRHLAQGLGHRASRGGRRVLFTLALEMFRSLRSSRADARCDQEIQKYAGVDLLNLDDFGLRTLTGEKSLDPYEMRRLRYEKSSTIITANRAVKENPPLFGDPLLASAAMDRMLHHRPIVLIEGPSNRAPPWPEQRKQGLCVMEAKI